MASSPSLAKVEAFNPPLYSCLDQPSFNPLSRSNVDQLVLDNLSLVHAVASKAYAQSPGNIELNTLIQAGILGIVDAALQMEGGDKSGFQAYAKNRIRGSILDSLRQKSSGPLE